MFQKDKFADLLDAPVSKPEPFTLASLIGWLERKSPEGRYDFCRAEDGCLWARYTAENGGQFDDPNNSYILNGVRMSCTLPDVEAIMPNLTENGATQVSFRRIGWKGWVAWLILGTNCRCLATSRRRAGQPIITGIGLTRHIGGRA